VRPFACLEPHLQPIQRLVALVKNAMRLRRLCGDRKKICQREISDQSSRQFPGKQEERKVSAMPDVTRTFCEHGEYWEIQELGHELPLS
jgi:hypothetical protein